MLLMTSNPVMVLLVICAAIGTAEALRGVTRWVTAHPLLVLPVFRSLSMVLPLVLPLMLYWLIVAFVYREVASLSELLSSLSLKL